MSYISMPSQDDLGISMLLSYISGGQPLPLKLSLSLSMHEPMLRLSMLVLDPNHPD